MRDKPTAAYGERIFSYDDKGRLVQAGNLTLTYDALGNMTSRVQTDVLETPKGHYSAHNVHGKLQLFYGNDTRLDKAILPHGLEVYYRYEKDSVLPTAIREGKFGNDIFRFIWDGLRLQSYYCSFKNTHFDFAYTNEGDRVPATATVRGGALVQQYGSDVQLAMEYNHVGSLQKVFAVLPSGEKLCIKSVTYTAFGIRIEDSNPALYFPLGFAGGLFDPYTGFVRFGVRDYDPALGRFTCPDPARFFGRDNDLYDYCEDDPVNYVDRTGLVPFFLLPLLGALAGPAMGVAVPYGIAQVMEYLKGRGKGDNASAVDAMNTILPMLTDTLGVGKLGGAMAGGAALAAPAVKDVWPLLLSHPEVIPAIRDAVLGWIDPNITPPTSFSGWVSTFFRNLPVLEEGVKGVIDDFKTSPLRNKHKSIKPAGKKNAGVKCSPATQPRDAQGQFASCGHD